MPARARRMAAQHRLHRIRLTDHPLRQGVEIQEFATLSGEQSLNRNPGPASDHISDVFRFHLLAQQGRAVGLILRLGRLEIIRRC